MPNINENNNLTEEEKYILSNLLTNDAVIITDGEFFHLIQYHNNEQLRQQILNDKIQRKKYGIIKSYN